MALSAKYQQFLGAPQQDALADKATINYITTLTTVAEPAAILKHLSAQSKLLTKKEEKVLGEVEGANGLTLEVETTLEFVNGGGAYLPGLDDNFVSDRTVTFPVVHIVQFDEQQKIRSIRLHWDQGSLLRQVDVIGSRSRNWPIRDGKEQVRMIANTVSATPALTRRDTDADSRTTRTSRSSTSATGDPHASLSLFQPREPEERSEFSPNGGVARSTSAKPAHRGLEEILGTKEEVPNVRSPSPSKSEFKAKGGAGKNFQPIRLFDVDEENAQSSRKSESQARKTNPKKYSHFEFGNGEDTPKKQPQTKTKHQSQWDFEQFATPDKVQTKVQPAAERHFGWSDDEVSSHKETVIMEEAQNSPVRRPIVHHARPDAKPHFEMTDESTPAADRKAPPTKSHKGLGLYKDPVMGGPDEDDEPATNNAPLNTLTTNTHNGGHRRKDFDPHFDMTDKSPAHGNGNSDTVTAEPVKKATNKLQPSWNLYETSPAGRKENELQLGSIYKTHGDGMGGNKAAGRSWGFGDESDEEVQKQKVGGKGSRAQKEAEKGFWDF
ncbi:hypothetical protein K490DRAFT_40292 [Saccharata proteae CBS 121410]|uniref:NTF2-like protein n=1 Tax=Saccharata proteae CBS 121410 TaxID=1314787 RepID=A0A9P4HX58_9PEZI|nr:hypothetical protein K490DRAFT_40292 [Saccharata proteae CBS 121410]